MSRVESYWVDLLDEDDNYIRTLPRKPVGGTVDLNVNAQIRGGGKITVMNDPDIDWMKNRLRVWFQAQGFDPIPLGTFVPTVPGFAKSVLGHSVEVEMHDKTQILVEDKVDGTYLLPAGTVVTQAVRDLIQQAGETSFAITASALTLPGDLSWEAGTTRLRIINDLLSSINYFSIWTDGLGVYQAIPYSRPAARPISHVFQRGRGSIHSPAWEREQDIAEVPNKIVLKSEGDAEDEALIGVATNEDPNSQFSYQRRGNRWIVYTEDGIEAADQSTIDNLARRRLIDLSSPSATLSTEHLLIPLQLNGVVRFISDPVDTLAVVEKMTYRLTPGSLVQATWREVVDL